MRIRQADETGGRLGSARLRSIGLGTPIAKLRAVGGSRAAVGLRRARQQNAGSASAPKIIYAELRGERIMSIGTILLIVLILALVGALPTWGYSSGWGYGPSGIAGVVVIILIILLLTGRL